MELKIQTPKFPEIIQFNYEELKQEITERASAYVNLVYTDDQIADAKKDRATLNKFVKALSDERIKIKKECLKPYEDFEAKIKELDGIVNKAIKNIDGQIKGYEEQKKAEKIAQVKEYFESLPVIEGFETLAFEQIFNPRWENASCSMRAIHDEISGRIHNIKSDLSALQNLPEFSFEAVEVYKTTLDLGKAISEGQRLSEIQKRKEEAERQKAETVKSLDGGVYVQDADKQGFTCHEPLPTEPLREAICFRAYLTPDDALALKDFFNSRGIPFEAI
jgi:hypothetical protein